MFTRVPQYRSVALLLVLTFALGGCCDPGSCRTARMTFRALEPVTTRVADFTDRQGHPPARLEDAFPKGLPANLRPLRPETPQRFQLGLENGTQRIIGYGPKDPPDSMPDTGATQLNFSYSGPGMNRCNWASDQRSWMCSGFY